MSYSFNTLLIETNSSWHLPESMKALKINTYMLINLDFTNSTILSCLFHFLIIDLYILIPVVINKVFNTTAEVAIPTGISTKEGR